MVRFNEKGFGVLLALSTGISWGIVSPLARILTDHGVDMLTVIVLRTVIVVLFIGGLLSLSGYGRGLKVQTGSLTLLVSIGIMGVLTSTGFLFSIQYLNVPIALLIHYLFPLATALGALVFLRERPTLKQFIAGVLILFGLWVGLFRNSYFSQIQFTGLGVFWGLLAVVGLSGQSLLGRFAALKGLDYRRLVFYSNLFGLLALGGVKMAFFGVSDLIAIPFSDLLLILAIGLIGGALASITYYSSLRFISSPLASLLCTSEIVVGMLGSSLLLKLAPSIPEMAGAFIIIFAIRLSLY
ncbi:MAG: DMT family transporter [Thermovirgaceae bacterium]